MKAQATIAVLLLLTACQSPDSSALFQLRPPEETGITFVNSLQEDDSVYNALDFDYIYNGAGVAVGDFDGDGLQDAYFGGNMVSSRLYLNRGEFRFEDVTEAAGVATTAWVTGVTTVDINQDGRQDLYLSVAGKVPEEQRANLLFVNQGPDANGIPRFVEQAAAYGIADTGYSTHAAFFDYDRDGDLDLYVLTNALENFNRNTIRPRRINGEAASTDRLYRNNGDGTFTNVSREAGIVIEGYGLGVAVSDLNRDGWPDVYAANDFLSNDLVWINNGDGTFTDRASEYLKHQTHNAMGTDVADYNNDGFLDIVVVDMLPRDNHRKKMMLPGSNYDKFHMSLELGYEPQYMRNTLQLGGGFSPAGTPVFSEIGQLAGIQATDWSWAPLFSDFDNDGLRDLYITNGYRRDVTNLDYIVYSQSSTTMTGSPERRKELLRELRTLPEVKLPNYVFRNNGDLTFTDETRAWGMDVPSFSNGAALVDLDNDGDVDLLVNNLDAEALVVENRADRLPSRGYLRVELKGPKGNLGGFGAKVTITAGGTRQYHDHSPYRGYKSSVEPIVHFGVGAATTIDSVQVLWPDGRYQLLTNVASNRVLTLQHADAGAAPPAETAAPASLFRSVAGADGLDIEHISRKVADFKHTPLLPHKHSQNGPGIAVGDVDGDGRDDVYVGAGRGQEKALYLQTRPGRFARRVLEGEAEYEDMGALFFDADGDGHLDLYVVSGGGLLANDSRRYQDRLYLNDGAGSLRGAPQGLPAVDASGSCVVGADYDADGDVDLFVCGRIIPGEYPKAPRSYLLRNDSRPGAPRFTDVTEEVAPGLARPGLVTAALWADYDEDGRTDLVLAGEWMPITFFRNQGARFSDATAATGLGATTGWWNSLAAGDFNNDGRTDYIAGNLGLNSEYRASAKEPVRLFAADFDGNGGVDPVLSYFIQGESYPAHSRDLMIDQMIGMKGRFTRYVDYAAATMDETLSRDERRAATVLEAVEFRTSYLENLGGGKFALRPLPLRAQFAPTFGVLVDDYDGDGNLDALLVGNSHASNTQIGWYTASNGSVLLGDGRGGFRHLDGPASGLHVDGDAKGAAELMLDERRSLLLVTRNNGALAAFSSVADAPGRAVRLQPGDAYAVLTHKDGRRRRQELAYGSTYLSQTTRWLKLPRDLARAEVYDSRGRRRVLQ